jgi:hypothetical protein
VDAKTRDNLTDRIGAIAGQQPDSPDLVQMEDLPVSEAARPNGRKDGRTNRQ